MISYIIHYPHIPYSRFRETIMWARWMYGPRMYGTRLLDDNVMRKDFERKTSPARGSTTTVTGQNMICPDLERPPPASAVGIM